MNPSDGPTGTKVQDSLFDEGQLNAVSDTGALQPAAATATSLEGDNYASIADEEAVMKQRFEAASGLKTRSRVLKFAALGTVLVIGLLLVGTRQLHSSNIGGTTTADASSRYHNVSIPLADLATNSAALLVQKTQTLSINGQLNVNNSLVLAPAARPDSAVTGQLYFDQTSKELSYYNGTAFVPLNQNTPAPLGVSSLGTATGTVGLGSGLAVNTGTLSNTGVLTLQGQAGNITLAGGPGIVVNGTTISNSGLLSLGGQGGNITVGSGLSISGGTLRNNGIISAVGAGLITVTNDGNGNITIDGPSGSGGGTVSSPGGTLNKIAKFTGVQTIADSLISDNGTTVTVGGNLSVTGTVNLTTPLAVTSGGTGANNAAGARTNLGAANSGANSDITSLSGLTTALTVAQGGIGIGTLATNGVILGNGTSPLTSAVAGSAGQCLVSTAGAPTWGPCPGAGGVSSLNGGTGALTLNNASLAGSAVTINDATTAAKGIASFNATNFTVTSGAVNTIQNINTAAAPTFGQLTLTSSQAANPMFVVNNTNIAASGALLDLQLNGASKFSVSPAGNITSAGTLNGQTISSSANLTGTLAVAGAINGQTISSSANFTGSVAVGTSLSVNTITPTSSLTVGSTGQSFLLQGNASSTLTATNGVSKTTVGFQTPTANVTYSFPTAPAGPYDICTTVGNCAGVGGGVTTPGGTANTIAKFTAGGVIGNSSITDNGTTVTVGGSLSVNTITPTSTLTIGATGQNLTLQGTTVSLSSTASGITNSLTFATPSGSNKTITIPNASGTLAVSATGPLALDSAGNLTCPTCLSSGGGGGTAGVTSIDSLTGALTLNDSTGSGTALTINNAKADGSTKGIGAFNGTNFTDNGSGVINTIQDISISAAPTFGQLTVTSSQAANAMMVINNTNTLATGNLIDLQLNGASKLSVAPNGNTTIAGTLTSGLINGQTISSSANFTGSVTVGTTLAVNTITPSSSLTIGATGQSFLLQGNGSSTITSRANGHTATLGFTGGSPTTDPIYKLDSSAPTNTYTICTTAGNCVGTGGSVSGSGTNNRIAKFTATGSVIGDSSITDNGSSVTLNTNVNLVLQGGTASISSAQSASGNNGNDLSILAGAGNGTDKNGGSLILQGGAATGTGGNGVVAVRPPTNGYAFFIEQADSTPVLAYDTVFKKLSVNAGTSTQYELTFTHSYDSTIGVEDNPGTGDGANLILHGGNGGSSNNNGGSVVLTGGNKSGSGIGGGVTVKNVANSSMAFQVQNASSTGIFTVDTAANVVQVGVGGAGAATPGYLALGVKSTTGDPAGGVEGEMYYNTFDNKFRCFQGAAWTDCITAGGAGSFIQNQAAAAQAASFFIQSANIGDVTGALRSKFGQTADIFQVQAVGGTPIFQVAANANLSTFTDNVLIKGQDAAPAALVVQSNSNANNTNIIADFQRSDGTSVARLANDGGLYLGLVNSTAGALHLATGTNVAYGAIDASGLTAQHVVHLPNEDGTICVQNSTNCGFAIATGSTAYIQNGTAAQTSANFNIRSSLSTNVAATIQGTTGQNADILDLQTYNGTTSTNVIQATANGSLILSGSGTSTYTTPNGGTVQGRLVIANTDPGAFGALIYTGVPIGASSDARVIAVGDGRASAHQPSLGVIAPNDQDVFGLTWDGSNTTATLKTNDRTSGGTDTVVVRSGNTGSGTAGNVAVDTGSGTTGNPTVSLGAVNATNINIGHSGAAVTATGATIGLTGNTTVTGVSSSSTALTVGTNAASNIGIRLQGASSQTADYLQVQDSTGANILHVDSAANLESLGYFDNGIGGIGQFQNLLRDSERLDNPTSNANSWGAGGNNVNIVIHNDDPAANPAPDGQAATGDLVSSLTTPDSLAQTTTTAVTNNNYTFSGWFKYSGGGTQYMELRIDGSASGTGTAKGFTATSTWQRFSVTQNTGSFSGNIKVVIFPGGAGNSGSVGVWGTQLVLGSSPQVYVRTTDSPIGANQGVVSNGAIWTNALNASDVPLVVMGAPSQSADLLRVENSSGTVLTRIAQDGSLYLQGSGAHISNPQGGSNAEAFGAGASVAGNHDNLAVGAFASSDTYGVSLGANATNALGSVAIGSDAHATGDGSLAIGKSSNSTFTGSIVLGVDGFTTANNQFVVGSTSHGITQMVVGNGVANNSPVGFTLQASSGLGGTANLGGASISIAGGVGTGNAAGGSINFQIAKPGGSGVSQNTLATVATISGTDGSALFKNAANSSTGFQIQNAAGASLLTVDTSANAITLLASNTGDTGAWSTVTNVPAAGRQYPGAVIFNGYMYVVGGADGTPSGQSTVYVARLNADGTPQAWSTTSALFSARFKAGVFVANDYLYVFGGADVTPNASNKIMYARINPVDGSLGTFVSEPTNILLGTRDGLTSLYLNGYAYMLGGEGVYSATSGANVTVSSQFARLNSDGSVGTWAATNTTGQAARKLHASVAVNGYVYMIGGQDNSAPTAASTSTVQYSKQNSDGTLGNWSTTSALPTALDSASASVANGYIYVTGGRSSGTAQSAVYYAKVNTDGTIGSWATSSRALGTTRYGNVTLAANGYLYSLEGYNGSLQNSIERAPLAKVQVNGDLDLIGLQNVTFTDTGNLSQGSAGGNLTAGNIRAVGGLNVTGQAQLNNGLSVTGNVAVTGQAAFRAQADSTTAFQIQNAAGNSALSVDTTAGAGNLISNGSFESGTTGWSAKGSATLSQGSSDYVYGAKSLQTATTTAGDGAKYPITLTDSTAYSLTFYAKASVTIATAFDFGYSSDGSTENTAGITSLNQSVGSTSGWTRFTLNFTTPGSHSGTPYIFMKQTDASARNVFIDGVALAQTASITAYSEGNTQFNGLVTTPLILQGSASNTAQLLVADTNGASVFKVDTRNARVGINTASPTADLTFGSNAGAGRTINIGTAGSGNNGDTLTIQSGSGNGTNKNGGGVTLQAGNATGSGTGGNVTLVAGTTSTGTAGAVIARPGTDSGIAFQVQNAAGSVALLTADSTNERLYVGPTAGDTVGAILVLGNKTNAGDPTGTNGAMYYNSSSNTFRCYQNGAWTNCIGVATADSSRQQSFYHTDFLSFNPTPPDYANAPWVGAAVNGGVNSTASLTITASHPGVEQLRSSAGGTNTGFSYLMGSSNIKLGGGESFEVTFNPGTFTNVTTRFGFMDATNQTDASNGAYFEINGSGVISGKTATGGTRSVTGTTYTMSLSTWYRAKVTMNAAGTTATYAVYDDSGTQLWTDTLSTNIPANAVSNGLVSTNSTATASSLLNIDYMAVWWNTALTR